MTTQDNAQSAVAARPQDYPRGRILATSADEARKSTRGRRLVRERVLSLGKDSIYNMTGLVRAFPLDPEDLPTLENQFTFYTHFLGRAEAMAVEFTGAHASQHDAVLCNRVTSAMLAIMLGTLQRGDAVISMVDQGRSHPSVQQAVELVGAEFSEVDSIEALEESLPLRPWKMLVITPLTPSKHHIPADQVRRAIELAKEHDMLVFVDDAHMMSRTIFYDEPPTFQMGDIDLSVWSLDKHVPGPRGAAISGTKRPHGAGFRQSLPVRSGSPVGPLRGNG